jgi:hypothetical protein
VGAISTTAASLRFASELAEMIPRKEIEIWLFVWIFFLRFFGGLGEALIPYVSLSSRIQIAIAILVHDTSSTASRWVQRIARRREGRREFPIGF